MHGKLPLVIPYAEYDSCFMVKDRWLRKMYKSGNLIFIFKVLSNPLILFH